MFTLDGLGKNGSIPGGKPSKERMLLLKREALELALYTFHYADDVDMVVTLLPPLPSERSEAAETLGELPPVPALFFRPGDLRGELGVPLDATLPPLTSRPGQNGLDEPEAKRIDALTRGNSFTRELPAGTGRQRLPGARPLTPREPIAGLCDSCRHQVVVRNTRGSAFSLCRRSRTEPGYPKYPRLPVLACRGHEPVSGGDGPAAPDPRDAA